MVSKHQEWKMLHLLYTNARRTGDRRVLTEQELTSAGVHCDPDSRQVLEDAGVGAQSQCLLRDWTCRRVREADISFQARECQPSCGLRRNTLLQLRSERPHGRASEAGYRAEEVV